MYDVGTFGPVTVGRGFAVAAGTRLWVYLYFVDGLLIDTGPRRLARGFRRFFGALPGVEQVAVTHLHEDHCGMASYAAAEGVPVYCHSDSVAAAARRMSLPLYRRVFWRTPKPFVAQPLSAKVETGRYSFDVIETPGHAADHVVLHEPGEGWLFAGDLYLGTRVVTIMREESLPTLMASIRRVLELEFDTLFCAHAGPVPAGKAKLRAKLEYLEELQGRVRALAEQGLSVREVTRRLFPKVRPLTVLSAGEYSPVNVVRSLWPEEAAAGLQNARSKPA